MAPPKRTYPKVEVEIQEFRPFGKRQTLSQSTLVGEDEESRTNCQSGVQREKETCVSRGKGKDLTLHACTSTLPKYTCLITHKNLPSECVYGFRKVFLPAVKDLCGTIKPWQAPSEEDITRIWNCCFPERKLKGALRVVVAKLARDIAHKWRQDLGRTAVESLDKFLKDFSDNPEERIEHAAWLLGDDEKDRKRPFYYKKYEDGETPSGIFRSPLIAATFANHLTSISRLPEEARLPDYPLGALAMSILAVKRALTWAKTGQDSIPRTFEGHFSRSNWGDHYRFEGGRYVFVKSASKVVAVVNKLRDSHWERILAEAEMYVARRKAPAVAFEEETIEDESDFEIEDGDIDVE